MPLPSVDPARIDEALAKFDKEERPTSKWQGWETRDNYKYAIEKDGKLYPPKEIIALATGIPNASFSGGAEANSYLRKYGIRIEALKLPTESEVQSALHDFLVSKAPISVEPTEAYQSLADQFALPERLRQKLMENTNENHWQNRVRFARRKLVDVGIIDPSEHGRWRLKLRMSPVVWVEKSLVKGRIDRTQGDHALGRALWSPLRAQNGSDIYRNMRLVQPNDIVLHLTDNTGFAGVSVAAGFARTDFLGISGTNWEGMSCYRIELRNFSPLVPPLTREQLINDLEIRKQLTAIRQRHSNLFYDPDLELHQGGYLTEAPGQLVELLTSAYNTLNGHPMPQPIPTRTNAPADAPLAPQIPIIQRNEPERVWLYAPGPKAVHWEEFKSANIAGIGWNRAGDLSTFTDSNSIKTRLDEVSSEPESLVNANQLFDFAKRISPGDWIFVKKGRKEIIGFGIVKSGYRYEPNRQFFKHVRDVDWQKSGSWPTAPHRLLSMKTLTEITDDESLIDELELLVGLSESQNPESLGRMPIFSAQDFSAETAIRQETIELWEKRLRRKKHLIFQGPPGTGKTFVAERLAQLLTGNTFGFIETVQFHPSYGYEDFMHGIRPVVHAGQMTFERMPGQFMQFCERARRVPTDSPCVLIVDEINRGNLSRVFGELMYLLEYRDKKIPLAGLTESFGIPANVYLIGTMNTADRSIAVVDHALRRRFSFVHLAPDYDVLRSHLEKSNLEADGLLKALRAVNSAIDDQNYEIGISFFLKDGAELRTTLRDVWEGEIEPYLEEYFFDQPSKIEPLRWKALSSGVLASWIEIP